MHLIMVREMAYYDTVGTEPNANPEDLKKAFEKLTIQCPPEDDPNGDKWLSKYDPIKQEDDTRGGKIVVINGKRHRLGSFRNTTPSYRKKKRFQMAQMVLVSKLHRVQVLQLGLLERALIETTAAPGSQIGDFRGIDGHITIMFVPKKDNRNISHICRLSADKGVILDNRLYIDHKLAQNNPVFNFGRIYLSWDGPVEELQFNITIEMSVMKAGRRYSRIVAEASTDVEVRLPGWNDQAPQNVQQQFAMFPVGHHFVYPVQHAAPNYAPQRFPMFQALANAQPNQQQAGENANARNVGPNIIWQPEYGNEFRDNYNL